MVLYKIKAVIIVRRIDKQIRRALEQIRDY
jgi:hypothetical protein